MRGGIVNTILNMLYPPRCPFCDKVLAFREMVCESCEEQLPFLQGNLCVCCGKPIPDAEQYCHSCKQQEHTFISGRAALLYNGVLQESVARYKYAGRQEYAECYGRILWEREGAWLKELNADFLVPVPLHQDRYRKRGYNQAELLAKSLSAYAGIPVTGDLLLRSKKTAPQKELSRQERLENLSQAFCINERTRCLCERAKCVILIDDIYTTGSTMEVCSNVLYNAGISKIYFLSLCIGKDY